MKQFLRLLSEIDTWQCSESNKMYAGLGPKMVEFQRLFAQMDILQQHMINIWPRDHLICANVLGSGSTTPPGVEFWMMKIRFYPAGQRKMKKEQGWINLYKPKKILTFNALASNFHQQELLSSQVPQMMRTKSHQSMMTILLMQ